MKIVISCLLLLCSFAGFGQNAFLSVNAPDSTLFQVRLDGEPLADSSNFQIRNVSVPVGQSTVALYDTAGLKICETRATFNSNNLNEYELVKLGDRGTLVLVTQTVINPEPAKVRTMNQVEVLNTENVLDDGVEIDDVAIDLPAYEGKRGCPSPNAAAELAGFESQLEKMYFQTDRMSAIIDFAEVKCLQVSDVKRLLSHLEYDDEKLVILKKIKAQIFDQENLDSLESVFLIESYKREWNRLLD